MKKQSYTLLAVAVMLIAVAAFFFYKGYDVKTNYYNSETFASKNVNAYVGGDAYNYVINGNYFTGYMVVGAASALGAIIAFCLMIYISYRNQDNTMDGMKAIYDEIKKITAQTNNSPVATGGTNNGQSI